jgi:arylsulfatase A
LATVSAIVGEKLPEDAGEDSFSMLPLLTGEKPARPVRTEIVHHSGDGAFALREGNWKAVFHLGSGGFSQPKREQPTADGPTGQLYDLENDPGETRNLWLDQPDVVARLSARMEVLKNAGRSRQQESR